MAYQWSEESYRSLPREVQEARELLEDWFWAMERGDVAGRLPDPSHQPPITQEMADAVVAALDEGFERELRSWAHKQEAGGYEAGPGFSRLPPPQRIVLAQQLRAVLRKNHPQDPGHGDSRRERLFR